MINDFCNKWPITYDLLLSWRSLCDKHVRQRSRLRAANLAYKGIESGKRCFILATGPSLSKEDLRSLNNELCISVSHFFLHADAPEVSPKYHVIAPNHEPHDYDLYREYIDEISRARTMPVTFFGYRPYKYSILNYFERFPEEMPWAIVDYSRNSYWNSFFGGYSLSIDSFPMGIQTVTHMALTIAIYMGCNPIYLLGCDHSNLRTRVLEKKTYSHFYSENNRREPKVTEDQAQEGTTLGHALKCEAAVWQGYLNIVKKAPAGTKIINLSADSLLDVFPKASLARILNPY